MRALYKRTKGKASNVQDRLYHKNVFCISNRTSSKSLPPMLPLWCMGSG